MKSGLPEYLTPADIAAALKVNKSTVTRLVQTGQLPAKRIGRAVRISERDYTNFLKGSNYETNRD